MSVIYDYFLAEVLPGKLHQEILDAGLATIESVSHNEGETPNNLHVYFSSALSGGDETTLDGVVAAHDPAPLVAPDPLDPVNRILTFADGSLVVSATDGNILTLRGI